MDRAAHSFLQAGVATLSHPLAYAKTLIQVGYEPMVPIQSTTLLGKPVLMYPNVLKYIGHIKRTDGFLGLYRGLTPRIISTIISNLVSNVVSAELVGQPLYAELSGKEEEGKTSSTAVAPASPVRKLVVDSSCESLARCAGIIASQPFYVIVVRQMCQFVGQETKYNTVSMSISEIWKNEGILGFFSGIVPRLIGEVLTIWLANMLTYVVSNYMLGSDEQATKNVRSYSGAFSQLVASQLTYPFVLISTVMVVNDSGLMASSLCQGAIYTSWTDCWLRLSKQGQLKRGSSMFWRRYAGASRTSVDGRLIPVVETNF
jgi:carrier protein